MSERHKNSHDYAMVASRRINGACTNLDKAFRGFRFSNKLDLTGQQKYLDVILELRVIQQRIHKL